MPVQPMISNPFYDGGPPGESQQSGPQASSPEGVITNPFFEGSANAIIAKHSIDAQSAKNPFFGASGKTAINPPANMSLPTPGAPIPSDIRKAYTIKTGNDAPTNYPESAKELPWWMDMALAVASYGVTAAALGLTTGGVGVIGTSLAAAPVYMAAKQAMTGQPTAPSLTSMIPGSEKVNQELLGAAEEMAMWGLTPPGTKMVLGVGGKLLKPITQAASKAWAPAAAGFWDNFIVPITNVPVPWAGKTVREMTQPAIERLANKSPLVAQTFRRSEIQKSMASDIGRFLRGEIEKSTPTEQFEIMKGLRGTPTSQLNTPRARQVLDQVEQNIKDARFRPEFENKFKEELSKRLTKPVEEIESNLPQASIDNLLRTYEMGTDPTFSIKKNIKVVHDNLRKVINDPAIPDMEKRFAMDMWNVSANTPVAVADSARQASMEYLLSKLTNYRGLVSATEKPNYMRMKSGGLKDMWVPRDVGLELDAIQQVPQIAKGWYNKWFMSPWKMGKVILRPATHARNVLSNAILNDWGGLPFYRVDVYGRAVAQMMKNGGAYKDFKRSTGVGTNFTQTDIYRLDAGMRYHPKGKEEIRMLERAGIDPSKQTSNMLDIGYGWFEKLAQPGVSLFNAEETLFKFAKYLHNVEQGMSKSEAILDSMKWTFNYSEITPEVAKLAKTAVPFARWQFKALPLMAETAIKHPVRFWKWPLIGYGMQAQALETVGLSNDEYGTIEKSFPDYMKNGMFMLMPWRDSKDRLNMLNLTYIMPGFGDVSELYNRGPVQSIIQNPLVTASATLLSKRKYSGAPLYYDWEDNSTKVAKSMWYMWEQMMPGPLGTDFKALYDAFTEDEPDTQSVEQALAAQLGIKIKPVDPVQQYLKRETIDRMVEAEITGEMNKELRRAKSADDYSKIVQKYESIKLERAKE